MLSFSVLLIDICMFSTWNYYKSVNFAHVFRRLSDIYFWCTLRTGTSGSGYICITMLDTTISMKPSPIVGIINLFYEINFLFFKSKNTTAPIFKTNVRMTL